MENQSCKNCKFFVRHFSKRLTELAETNCGHYRKKLLTKKEKCGFPFENGCEQWQPAEQNNERKEEIKTVIRKMQEHLEQIVLLLQNENEP